jgi:N-acetylmuramoyl-L-alanine amidase
MQGSAWRSLAAAAIGAVLVHGKGASALAQSQSVAREAEVHTAIGGWSTHAAAPETGSKQPARAASFVSRPALAGDATRTRFTLELSRSVRPHVFTLATPYRVIVDLPQVAFRLGEADGSTGVGLVSAFRYGQFDAGKGRIVLDTTGPVRIESTQLQPSGAGGSVVLTIVLAATDAAAFGAGTGLARDAAPAQPEAQPATASRTRPVVVIDAGHGGIDPGAIGADNLREKTIVLAVAEQLRLALAASGRYELVMTRASDVFVPLAKRVEISRRHAADLFVSIHADSIGSKESAQAIRGATVYTLSERASDEQARLMAEKENASDFLAGIDRGETETKDDVRGILIDLLQRETASFSAEFSRVLVGKLGSAIPLSREPQRSAAFKVLKQTHAPSVLVELGYMSNAEDARLMTSSAWQKQVAGSLAAAVEAYFARRTVQRGPP